MKILVINCGSSSLKYQLIDMDGEKVLCKGLCERIGMESSMITHEANGHKATTPAIFPTHTEAFAEVVKKMTTGEGKCINDVSEIDAIGHRVVHGGEKFKASCLITDDVINTIRELSPLAPLHNPAGILGIEAARKVFGNVPMVAVFDTAFHSTMPPKAYMYAIPYEYYEKYGVRRYGFHGTSHKYVAHKAAEYLEEPIERLKLITCHLGNGSSIAAVDQGKVVDTSMGMTPLAGLMMGTRCGDLDPSVVNYLKYTLNITGHELDEILNKKSGLLGISGVSSDKRDVEEAALHGNKRAQLASDMLNYQIKKIVGSYIAAMGGVDVITFTARLFGVSAGSAARKLEVDFGIVGGDVAVVRKSPAQRKYEDWVYHAREVLREYNLLLVKWKSRPPNSGMDFPQSFTEALQNSATVKELLWELSFGTEEEKQDIYLHYKEIIKEYEQRIHDYDKRGNPSDAPDQQQGSRHAESRKLHAGLPE